MNPKNSKKSPIHENAGANITCDFGDGDISRSRSFLSNTCDTYIHTHISINQSIILFADTNVSQWAHVIQRSIDYVINNPTLNTEIA